MKKTVREGTGAIILAKNTGRVLFLMRNSLRFKGCWGWPGGKVEKSETVYGALLREITEEIGTVPEIEKVYPIDLYTSDDLRFFYHTFVIVTPNEFIPKLNGEHSGWAWCTLDQWPKPIHPAIKGTLTDLSVKSKISTIENLYHQ